MRIDPAIARRVPLLAAICFCAGCLVSPDPGLYQRGQDAGPDAGSRDLDPSSYDTQGADGPADAVSEGLLDLAVDSVLPDQEPPQPDAGGCARGTGSWVILSPQPLDVLNSSADDIEPSLSPDGLTFYFSSAREGEHQVYVATRPSRSEPFDQPTPLSSVNSGYGDSRFAVAADELSAYLASERPGGPGNSDLWMATRASISQPWDSSMFVLMDISTTSNDWDPFPSANGLRLYYVIQDDPAGAGAVDLFVAERSSPSSPFANPLPLSELNTAEGDDNPAVTADELVIVFGSSRPGGQGSHDIWYAVRDSVSDPFGTPQPLPVVNTAYHDSETFLSLDGCELFFTSTRQGGDAKNLYRAEVQASP